MEIINKKLTYKGNDLRIIKNKEDIGGNKVILAHWCDREDDNKKKLGKFYLDFFNKKGEYIE